ncbi:hypothetical protein [Mycoplasmopsis felis]|uniref:hypothetical protein n=1 Tax=Mycoplasmopsis felis TaxID=33923 RepID=UPI002AFEE140|nr:hypothetical protein [Mycoplasmopsis felis]WQQ03504.1 hypothetical protein RRG38_01440 [Mycoplasmopsis felis]
MKKDKNNRKTKLFRLYKMNEKLHSSLCKFSQNDIYGLFPIFIIEKDVIFGELLNNKTNTEDTDFTELYNNKKMWNLKLMYKNFYRMDIDTFSEHTFIDEESEKLGNISEMNELNILDKIKYHFTNEEIQTKLTYIYPKQNLENKTATI